MGENGGYVPKLGSRLEGARWHTLQGSFPQLLPAPPLPSLDSLAMTVLTKTEPDTELSVAEPNGLDAPPSYSHRKEIITVVSVIGLLAGLNFLAHFTPLSLWFFTIPVGVGVILLLGRAMGHTMADIGISRSTLKKGLKYGSIAAGIVLLGVLIGVLLPITRRLSPQRLLFFGTNCATCGLRPHPHPNCPPGRTGFPRDPA